MGMPVININFSETAISTVERSENSTLMLILRNEDYADTNPAVVTSISDIPSTIGDDNIEYIKLALLGNVIRPKKIYCYVIGSDNSIDDALAWAETKRIDWIADPKATTEGTTTTIASWVKGVNSDSKNFIMAVLPKTASNDENIVNWTTETVKVGDREFTAEEYTARIAGLICGTPLNQSITYAVLYEADACDAISKSAMDTAVDNGELICFFDGEKVKLGRAVNSLKTATASKGAQFKKIKIAETVNNIKYDLYKAIEDGYVGKFANTYENRSLLLSAVQDYFDTLVGENLITSYDAAFDIDAIKKAMKTSGIKYDDMSDTEIIEYNFGTTVYIAINCRMLDAIEDIYINIAI